LLKKGFVQQEDAGHQVFHLFVDGVKTRIRTRYSHGAKECGDYILGHMAKHLRLSREQLNDLFDCVLGGDAYIEILKKRGDLAPSYSNSK